MHRKQQDSRTGIAWQSHIIGRLSFLLLKTSDIFRKAVHSIIMAGDYYKPSFDTEQVSDIKSALNLFGDDRQSHRAAGDFLYFTARQKGEFDNREQIKARREIDNVVEGNYDQAAEKRIFNEKITHKRILIILYEFDVQSNKKRNFVNISKENMAKNTDKQAIENIR